LWQPGREKLYSWLWSLWCFSAWGAGVATLDARGRIGLPFDVEAYSLWTMIAEWRREVASARGLWASLRSTVPFCNVWGLLPGAAAEDIFSIPAQVGPVGNALTFKRFRKLSELVGVLDATLARLPWPHDPQVILLAIEDFAKFLQELPVDEATNEPPWFKSCRGHEIHILGHHGLYIARGRG